MAKQRYRVLVEGFCYPTDPAVIKRLLAGEQVPWQERKVKEVPAGAVVDDVPAASVASCLAQGWIEPVEGGA